MSEKTMMYIDKSLRDRIKIQALKENRTMKALLEEMVKDRERRNVTQG